MKEDRATRRDILKIAMAASAAIFPMPAIAQQSGARVVVVGGGFGGAACARALKRANARLAVSLVESNRRYTACPMSNAAIAGLRDLKLQDFGYDRVAAAGVAMIFAAATAIDPAARLVTLADGQKLGYERLVLAPGIDFRWDALPGYSPAVATSIPHAWKDGEQIALLTRQIAAMEDGGVVVISVPVTPSRCPPAPYERASLIAHTLKTRKPRSKVIVLDAKDSFTMQRQFQGAWKRVYPDVLEYVSLSDGGLVTAVEAATKTIMTDFDKFTPAVANIIPQQKAGHLAELAMVADRTGWCPVDPVTFESRLQPNIHVIGDAAIAGAMPRSASAASSQAKICASAVVALLAGGTPTAPTLTSSCYSLIAPDYAISQTGSYRPVGDIYNEVEGGGGLSPVDAPPELRAREAREADAWFTSITAEVFG
jgi:NADPH-dependent 2,4-dienoyl-CoA reductase/sulfur reductase-like enzyme